MTLLRISIAAALLTSLAFVSGCFTHHGCSLVGCADRVDVDATLTQSRGSGVYAIAVTTLGETVEASTEWTEETLGNANSPRTCGVGFCVTFFYDGETVAVDIAPTDELPGEVAIDFLFDGQVIGETIVRPAYSDSAPNGEDCGPVCKVSMTSVAI